MTLLEVLLALTLLSALAIASAGLVGLAAGTMAESYGQERWRAAADAALDGVERDAMAGDFDPATDPGRVTVAQGLLAIVTRGTAHDDASGPSAHVYRFDADRGELWRDEREVQGARGGPRRVRDSRLLLGRVTGWSVVLDAKSGMVGFAIAGPGDQRLERRVRTR
jgi:hypothetical protein